MISKNTGKTKCNFMIKLIVGTKRTLQLQITRQNINPSYMYKYMYLFYFQNDHVNGMVKKFIKI